jgi:hypothetical protein
MNLYNYPLISPFDISCQQEVKSIYNQVPQVQEAKTKLVLNLFIIVRYIIILHLFY